MNRARAVHRADISRNGVAPGSDGIQSRPGLAPLVTGLDCLLEGIHGKAKASILGRIQGAAFVVTWYTNGLREGDVFSVTAGPVKAVGRLFKLAEILDDTGRPSQPYYTGILAEHKHG